jgi:hypothetical protein
MKNPFWSSVAPDPSVMHLPTWNIPASVLRHQELSDAEIDRIAKRVVELMKANKP